MWRVSQKSLGLQQLKPLVCKKDTSSNAECWCLNCQIDIAQGKLWSCGQVWRTFIVEVARCHRWFIVTSGQWWGCVDLCANLVHIFQVWPWWQSLCLSHVFWTIGSSPKKRWPSHSLAQLDFQRGFKNTPTVEALQAPLYRLSWDCDHIELHSPVIGRGFLTNHFSNKIWLRWPVH